MTSYAVLGILALLAGIFIYSEFKDYIAPQTKDGNNQQLLKTNTLFAQLYEAENLSKLAIQTKKIKNLKAYARKVDSMSQTLDTLKLLSKNHGQALKLDSIQKLLQQKVFNSSELRKLKVKNENNAPIDSVLTAFNKMEVDMGRITPETFVPDFERLPSQTQNSIREYVALLNRNIPTEYDQTGNAKSLDSVLKLTKSILDDAKAEQRKIDQSTLEKELQIYRTDIQLSQKLRSVISELEQELIENVKLDNHNKQQTLTKSIRLAGGAAILGVLVVALFTFFISRDFWKIQQYRNRLETEKKYSESLLQSREQLISTVSHDLKTPLGTIGGYTELLEQSNASNQQLKYLKKVKSATGYVEKLANDLLDYSKLEHGKMAIEKVPFDLFSLIEETAFSIKEFHINKPVVLDLEISEALKAPILNDPFRIRQILSNLIGNAFKFTNEGHVKINAGIVKNSGKTIIKIDIIDSGMGIDPKDQQTIFEEFKQAGNSPKKTFGGYGLGLTISKKLAGLLGGNLSLKSEVSKGSVFTVVLPCEFSKARVKAQNPKVGLPNKALSLLIFDDDMALLELLREICKMHSINAYTFSSFAEFDKSLNLYYDVVLTDIQMPNIDGIEVIQKLKNVPKYGYVNQPIIVMTGQKDLDKSILASIGVGKLLEKPFSSVQFIQTLASVTNTKVHGIDQMLIPEHKFNQFSIKTISGFVDTPGALRKVLLTFIDNTKKNLSLLTDAIQTGDQKEIRNISHKMLPMFRQLKVRSAVEILEKLEKIPKDAQGKKEIEALERIFFKLERALQKYLARLPIDTD